jgi:L-ascorbate metabolism protein UlaG (beta-lactamase superfamily)
MPPVEPATVTWLGHATVLLEIEGTRALTDPLLGRFLGPLVRVGAPVEERAGRAIDVVLLSHLHADHADPRSLRRIGGDVQVVAPKGARRWLRRRGIANVRELSPHETVTIGPLTIAAVPADHADRRHRFGPRAPAVGYVLRGSRTIYFAGDTALFPEMAEIPRSLDLALLPVGGWGPSLGPGHLDPETAAEAARLIRPRVAIPIHWGTLSLPWRTHDVVDAGSAFAARTALVAPDVEVRVLRPGESTTLA